jgi:Na+-translocating ferredoxin:NAD+ oxidoreductase RnfC subunit
MADSIVEQVKAAGVVGAGGAGFPTYVKIGAQVDTIIANGAECEPLLYCDQHLMAAHPDLVVEGLRLVMQSTGAERGIIALKRKYHEAVEAFTHLLEKQKAAKSQETPVEMHIIERSTYPAGDEYVLVYEVTGRLVPQAGLPLDVGCVVQNVQTLANIAMAVQEGRPVTHRQLTVTGAVREPKTVRVPIGMLFGEVLELAGGVTLPAGEYGIVVGGPMMGRLVESVDEPVTKTTSGLIALPRDNVVVTRMARPLDNWMRLGRSTCDQCRDCTVLCPRYLLGHGFRPHEIMRAVGYGIKGPTEIMTGAMLCCECRVCEAYACPLGLSAMAFYKALKRKLAAEGYRHPKVADFSPHPFREFRLVPVERLVNRLGLREYYERHCVLDESEVHPTRVVIPLKQHIGAPSVPVVSVGDKVQVGDLISAIPEGKLGANMHASISGRVTDVTDQSITIAA